MGTKYHNATTTGIASNTNSQQTPWTFQKVQHFEDVKKRTKPVAY